MLLRFLSYFETVQLARTDEEIDAIFRFRHTIYIKEPHWNVSEDQQQQMIVDDEDRAPNSKFCFD